MSMYVILHKVLLMADPPMLPLLIDEVTTISRLVLLYLSGLHNSQDKILSFTNILRKIWC